MTPPEPITRAVWKFPFAIADEFTVQMPVASEILHVATQLQGEVAILSAFGGAPSAFETPCLWALVDTDAPMVERRFILRGTGHAMPDGPHRHVATFMQAGGAWHVFERMNS